MSALISRSFPSKFVSASFNFFIKIYNLCTYISLHKSVLHRTKNISRYIHIYIIYIISVISDVDRRLDE